MRILATQVVGSLVVWVLASTSLYGGIPSRHGDEPCCWEYTSLIVAIVLATERDFLARKYRGVPDYVTLDPKLTVAGSFDCAGAGQMKIPISIGEFASPLDAPPPVGSLVLVHIRLANEGYFVPGFVARYMPENLPAWEVWGLHDELLLKTVRIVGERRREAARNEEVLKYDCSTWREREYAKFIKPPVDKSFEKRSVVLVRIKSVETDETGHTKVLLRLIGTAAGRLDSALLGELEVIIPAKLAAERELPTRSAEMFVALDWREGKYVLPEEKLDYLPSGWAFSHLENSVEATCDAILTALRRRIESADK